MKTKKIVKSLLSVALVFAMLFSMSVVGFTSVSAEGTSINYEFAYKNAGYAEGRIRLENADGTYFLYWADDTKALEGYHEIAVISSDDIKPFEMGWGTAIPAGATKVIAIKSDTIPEVKTVAAADAVFDIPAEKQFKGGVKQYSFEALSDIHVQHDDSYWYLSKPHFANALEVAAKRGVDFITICGDMVNGYGYSNLQKEYPQYLKLIAQSNYNNPIYETNGNHEIKGNGDKVAQQQDFDLYRKYTGLNAATGAVQTTPYYEKTINGDHYIFLVLELSGAPNESSEFTTAQLDWFEGLLNKYKDDGHKIIVNQHALIRGYGAGDNKLTPHYGGALVQDYAEVKRLMAIMEANPEIIMLNGHSHIDFKYGYNFDNEDGKTCYTVHIPSTSSTTQPDNGGALKAYEQTMHANSSQGYLVDVYDDYVVLNGTDLAFNSVFPAYTYMVDYTGEELVKNEMEEIVYDTVKVTVDISKLCDAPQSVICTIIDSKGGAVDNVAMTKNSDGTYSADVYKEAAQVYFTINTAQGMLKTSAFNNANCIITLGYQILTFAPTADINENVNAHFWGDGGNGTEWPGYAMTKDASGNFVAKIPASDYTGVVFNEGASPAPKTEDLEIAGYLSSKIGDIYTTVAVDDPTDPSTQPTETEPVTTEATEATEATEPTEVTTEATTAATEPTEVTTEATEATTETTLPTEIPTTVVTETTEPTEVITSTPDETTVPTTATVPTTETTAPIAEYLYGDADLNEKINVKDATTVQKHTAKMLTLEDKAYAQADVTGDGKVNIKDATAIQKYVAKLITVFPVEEGTAQLAVVGANATLMAEVKTVLSKEYQYASYDAYMALKKAYMNNVTDDELNAAYADYNKMKNKNPLANPGETANIGTIDIGSTGTGLPHHLIPEGGASEGGTPEGEITVYFSNTNNWSVVKAYVWGSSPLKTWPGTDMTDTGISSNSGKKLYKITFDASTYKNIIFTDGSEQTVDIILPANADGLVYHLSTKEGTKYTVGSYAYSDKYQ
ncbi:MAG: starch-binding protein [Ruminococcus sp.]|nr:starch-binding protein [Ruminococcus sp.]